MPRQHRGDVAAVALDGDGGMGIQGLSLLCRLWLIMRIKIKKKKSASVHVIRHQSSVRAVSY